MSQTSLTTVALIVASLIGIAPVNAGDRVIFPPVHPGIAPPPLTEETVQKGIDASTEARFKAIAAAGASQKVITTEQAKGAGWGFVDDHFAQIDKNGDGFVSLGDISRFLGARSPLKTTREKTVHVLE
jgi:hypothetical protein